MITFNDRLKAKWYDATMPKPSGERTPVMAFRSVVGALFALAPRAAGEVKGFRSAMLAAFAALTAGLVALVIQTTFGGTIEVGQELARSIVLHDQGPQAVNFSLHAEGPFRFSVSGFPFGHSQKKCAAE